VLSSPLEVTDVNLNDLADKGIRIVKSSTLAGRAVPGRSPFVEGIDEPEWNVRLSERQSWEIVPDGQ
jgi:hypothetical protein